MQYRNKYLCIALLIVLVLFALLSVVIVVDFSLERNYLFDPQRSSMLGSFLGGVFTPLLTTFSTLLLLISLVHQGRERSKDRLREQFFKMIEYHNQRVDRFMLEIPVGLALDTSGQMLTSGAVLRGEYVFVELKRQIYIIYKEVQKLPDEWFVYTEEVAPSLRLKLRQRMDTAYIIFYYGLDEGRLDFIKQELLYIKEKHKQAAVSQLASSLSGQIQRVNQTVLSSYFRNMYHAIRLVDSSPLFQDEEKRTLIESYRAQLSNPELYIVAFNLASRFGTKWEEARFVYKYELISNIPTGYIEGVDLRTIFDIRYEEDDYHSGH